MKYIGANTLAVINARRLFRCEFDEKKARSISLSPGFVLIALSVKSSSNQCNHLLIVIPYKGLHGLIFCHAQLIISVGCFPGPVFCPHPELPGIIAREYRPVL